MMTVSVSTTWSWQPPRDATGKDPGRTPKEWREALARGNRSDRPSKTPMKPTFGEMATLVYQPVFAPVGYRDTTADSSVRGQLDRSSTASFRSGSSAPKARVHYM